MQYSNNAEPMKKIGWRRSQAIFTKKDEVDV